MTTFHRGELEVQKRAGVGAVAARVGQSIGETMPFAAQQFLRAQPFVVLGGADDLGQVWASLVRGEPGFARALDETTLQLDAQIAPGDPLRDVLHDEAPVGLLAIEPATRRRMRLNGTAQIDADGLLISAHQVYSNCPKYIQKRELQLVEATACEVSQVSRTRQLSRQQTQFIERADTFFIASLAPEGGADASHRGGAPSFVRVASERHLVFPDYSGNAMFNTLGNLQINPRAGLLFVDWERGATLQLSGTAHVDWNAHRSAAFPGAERIVEFEIEAVVAIENSESWRWKLVEVSPFNPFVEKLTS
ncbi:MAG TPA: pyridoxamine 5'-phosphate oxidase family protein [Abditibacterium sp.]